MRYKKCCVPGCNNKRGAMILHKFPICSKRRRIWLDSINCPSLRAMSMVEICKQCVCHKHFEGRFVTLKSRLLIQAYPTLFTEKEISSGVPTHPNSEVLNPSHRVDPSTHLRYFQTQLVDHNYFASSSKDPEPSTLEYVLLIGHNLTPAPVAELEFQDTENPSPKHSLKRRKSYKEYKKREAGLTPSLGLVKQFREKTMLEVCVDSLESAINAIHGGADELEVCSSLTEAGLTPSPGLVKQIREMVDNISKRKPIRKSCNKCACESLTKVPKINVMIRCRTGSDFHYSKEEMDTMLYDIDVFKDSGIDRFVFGALTDTQDIDELNCTKIMHRAHPIPVTFHRAFDVCKDPKKAIEKIIDLGFDRLLTSGQKPAANEEGAIELLTSLIKSHGDNIQIMPGAGVTLGNVNTFIDIGCNIVHSSCKFIRSLPQIKDGKSVGITDGEYIYVTVEDTVRKMKNILSGEATVS